MNNYRKILINCQYIVVIITIILSSKITTAQVTGWSWVNPKPQGNSLNSSVITGSNNAFVAGDWGAFYKTTNYGLNWIYTYTNIDKNFSGVYFINQNTGYAVGGLSENVMAKTTNGGANWLLLNTGITDWLQSVYFFDENTGIACSNNGKIIRTIDAGNSWSVNTQFQYFNLRSISKAGQSTCFIAAQNRIIKTTDRGVVWTYTLLTDTVYNLTNLFFVDENIGYSVGDNPARIIKTTNGGANWFRQSPGVNLHLNSVYFINYNTGFVSGGEGSANGTILLTTNGGNNWNILLTGYEHCLNTVNFFNENTGYAAGVDGGFIYTSDGGTIWNSISYSATRGYLNCIRFVNSETGYTGGNEKKLYKTTNGGVNWSVNFNFPTWINTIFFLNENIGYVGGGSGYYDGVIYKTTNGGINWLSQTFFSYRHIDDICFPDELTGYATFNTNLLKTTNAGINWNEINVGTGSVYKLDFVNSTTGFAIAGSIFFIKTTNGGSNWSTQFFYNTDLGDVEFINSELGFLLSVYGTIYKTTNGGNNWSSYYLPLNPYIDITFVNENTGYICGQNIIYKTINSGQNWFEQYSPAYSALNSMYFVNSVSGYICGHNGAILKTTDGGGIIKIESNSGEIPKQFLLTQNYPNPFNPVTNIKFEIPKSGFAKITIYDLLGREITTLVNQQMKPGSYNVDWDASNYPSGVYFYKLETENFTESKKMVLIK